jgi:hypothetical protein
MTASPVRLDDGSGGAYRREESGLQPRVSWDLEDAAQGIRWAQMAAIAGAMRRDTDATPRQSAAGRRIVQRAQ